MEAEVLSRNMFLNYIGKPSIYLPVCMIIWGTLSTLTGATHKCVPLIFYIIDTPNQYIFSFIGALMTRFFLGVCGL